MPNFTWFRLYHDAPNDRKLIRACRMSGQPKTLVLGFWTLLLCMASDSPERGRLLYGEDVPVTDDDMAREAELDPIATGKMLETFLKLGMLSRSASYEITNWGKRQFKSDNSSARVQAYRERKQAEKERKETKERKEESRTEKEAETYTYTERNVTSNVSETLQHEHIPEPAQELITALSTVAKQAFYPKNEEEYMNTALALLGWDASPVQVVGFGDWWSVNGWHNDRPALSNIVNEWQSYVNGEVKKPKKTKDDTMDRLKARMNEQEANR